MAQATGLTSIAALAKRPDPLQAWRWVCDVLPMGGPDPSYLLDVDIPFVNISIGPGQHVNATFNYYPGTYNIASFNATFYEDHFGTSLKWVTQWKSKVCNSDSVYGIPKDYKSNWTFTLIDSKGLGVVKVVLQGVWPADTSNWALGVQNINTLNVAQTFSCDGQGIEFIKLGGKF